MRKLIGTLFAMSLFTPCAFAQNDEEMHDLNLESTVLPELPQDSEGMAEVDSLRDRNPLDLLGRLKDYLEYLKTGVIASYDDNNNGVLEPAELDNLKTSFNLGALSYIDAFAEIYENLDPNDPNLSWSQKLEVKAFLKVSRDVCAILNKKVKLPVESVADFTLGPILLTECIKYKLLD